MPISEESLRELVSLSGVVLAQQNLEDTHAKITRIAVRALPVADGATVTTFSNGRPTAAAASDAWARELDEMQYVEHEGPCLDAARTGNVFRVIDLEGETRWPTYLPRAHAAGVRSLLSLPLSAEGRLMGALNLYSRSEGAFDAEAASIGVVIAAHAGMATEVASAFFGHRELAEQMRSAMASRAVIEQAKGLVMGAHDEGPDAAFERLRTASQERNVKLRDLAQRVVDARSASPLD